MASSSSPTILIQQSQATNSMAGTQYTFPGDLTSAPNYCQLQFAQYSRQNPSSLTTENRTGTVNLPMPENLVENYGIKYTGSDLGLFGGDLSKTYEKIQAEISNAWEKGRSIVNDIRNTNGDAGAGSQVLNEIKNAFGSLSSHDLWAKAIAFTPRTLWDTQIGRAIAANVGVIPNPHLTAIFEGMTLRPFTFNWRFSPRSQAESTTLNNIINFLRVRALPSYTAKTDKYALDYPDEVYITYPTTTFLETPKKSVITNIAVDRSGGGQMAFYQGGAPVFITMSLSLMEVEIRTREDYDGTSSPTAQSINGQGGV